VIDTVALREKVLDLAIRGKLVPQDPNDEPASVLLERIRAQKQQMVKDGKLKAKDIKDDSIIFVGEDNLHYEKFADGTEKCIEDEIPFELPPSWSWCRLGVLFAHNTGKALNSSDTTGTRLTYITTSNLYWDRFELDSLKEMPFTGSEIEKCTVRKGDLLVCEGGDIGRSAIWLFDDEIRIQNHIHRLRSYIELSNRFYYYVMYLWKRMERIGGQGIGLQGFSSKALHKLIVPLPPVNEQFSVVEKLDSILGSVDALDELNAEFTVDVECIKKQILDLAIRGKLVPQNPDDEPASVLLERIKAEKEELIKAGKIKRDKKESVIFKGEDNSYYDEIPKNWAMTTLNQLTHALLLNDGDWILSENMNPQGEVKLIQLGSVGMMQYVDKGFKYLSENTFQELNCTQIYSGFMLINRIVSDKMCSCMLPSIEGKLITTVDTCWVAPKEVWYNLKYLMYTLSSPTFQSLVMLNSAGTTRKRISKNNLINLPFAVPPLEEQYRIVEAIDNAFNQLDTIAESLN
jgi:type I restriction enzyme S subunit